MPPAAVWLLTAALMLAALAGTFVPWVPDAPLILAAAVFHKLFLPAYLSYWTLALFAVLAVGSVLLDAVCTVVGARRYGASGWGLLGAGLGALAGLGLGFFGAPIGALLGAAAAEALFARRPLADALRAGVGSGLGLLASSLGRFVICCSMIAVFLLDCFVFR
ncbi:MAG TPA: DUF456 domain-containing protein [Elusimicrobiota bacterium]|jgi:uncharacterized protein YqgC (DUF456 family)|nr:DUF456 domain-containing protein [Elusimicrobiota bacterium]